MGYGKPFSALSEAQRIESLRLVSLNFPICISSLAASKISICLFLLRIMNKTTAKIQRVFLYSIIAAMVANAVTVGGYSLGRCHPVQKQWDGTVFGHCLNPSTDSQLRIANAGKHYPDVINAD